MAKGKSSKKKAAKPAPKTGKKAAAKKKPAAKNAAPKKSVAKKAPAKKKGKAKPAQPSAPAPIPTNSLHSPSLLTNQRHFAELKPVSDGPWTANDSDSFFSSQYYKAEG